MIRYNLAKTRDDIASLRRLLRGYPTWKEPREVLKRLEAQNSRSKRR
jgi:hypothetical protein